jgi:hypothetical protein
MYALRIGRYRYLSLSLYVGKISVYVYVYVCTSMYEYVRVVSCLDPAGYSDNIDIHIKS